MLIHVIELLAELQNAEISSVILLKSNSTTDALPAISKIIRTLTGFVCDGESFE